MSNELQNIKNRFGIIGNFPALNRALEKSIQVAPTDISVLVIGESGVGKEFIPKIIHSESRRKHQPYIVVNCGAIPKERLIPNYSDTKKELYRSYSYQKRIF
jgi:transcriptional regulator with PAS, ATPase and Fis domain